MASQRVTLEITAKGARSVEGELGKVRRGLEVTRKIAGRMSTALSGAYGVMAGAGAAAAAKRVLDYGKALGRLQADMGASNEEAQALSQTILSSSEAHGVTKESLVEAMGVYQDFGGIAREGAKTLEKLAIVEKATGASSADLAKITSTLITTLGMSPEGAVNALAAFNAQALEGRMSLRQIAGQIPKVLGIMKGYGFTGERGVQQIGTLLSTVAASGLSPEEVVTQSLAMVRDITKGANLKKLKKAGVDVWADEAQTQLRDLDDIMRRIYEVTGGGKMHQKKGLGLGDIFTEESRKGAAAVTPTAWAKIAAASTAATWEQIQQQYERATQGVAKEAEQVQRALATLDRGLMEHGGAIVRWFAADLPRGLGTVLSGVLAAKFAGPLVGALAGAQGAISTLGATAGMAAYGLAPLAAAAAIGYALGTALDRLLGISDDVADFFFRLLHPEAAKKLDEAAFNKRWGTAGSTGPQTVAEAQANLVKQFGVEAPAPAPAPGGAAPPAKAGKSTGAIYININNRTGLDGIRAKADRGEPQGGPR